MLAEIPNGNGQPKVRKALQLPSEYTIDGGWQRREACDLIAAW